MLAPEEMYTFECRLGSFAGARPTKKGRGSTAKSQQKTVSWPLTTPSPTQVGHNFVISKDCAKLDHCK